MKATRCAFNSCAEYATWQCGQYVNDGETVGTWFDDLDRSGLVKDDIFYTSIFYAPYAWDGESNTAAGCIEDHEGVDGCLVAFGRDASVVNVDWIADSVTEIDATKAEQAKPFNAVLVELREQATDGV